jgi:hypothetical protein
MEFFDLDDPAPDACVKFAMYSGKYVFDRDGDGASTVYADGDCNDHDPERSPMKAEVSANSKDDDCDGLADETEEMVGSETVVTPSSNADDMDRDGVTIRDGDCDDTDSAVLGPSAPETCSDGRDNDCDGAADHGISADDRAECTPYDSSPDPIEIEASSFADDGSPLFPFVNGAIADREGALRLTAGPSRLSILIPTELIGDVSLALSCVQLQGTFTRMAGGFGIADGLMGGIISAPDADKIRGIEFTEIGLKPEDSFLDVTFANVLGGLIRLPRRSEGEWAECYTPDVDVDLDGLEAFCDSNKMDDRMQVDVCVDGDGTVFRDELDAMGAVSRDCTEARSANGDLLFADGISAGVNFRAVPTLLPDALP